ncbi:MAG: cytochrome c3 family protein, partial [Myxococcales bacterium]|nr:cytochrome c3 family protein [Myxococcales bacterium]
FDHIVHVRNGVHCTRCHEGVAEATTAAPNHLPDSAKCAGCHATAHAAGSAEAQGDCNGCHLNPETPATLARLGASLYFDHAAHLPRIGEDCVRCHRGAADPSERAAPQMDDCGQCHQGWIDDARCSRCHVSLVDWPLAPLSANVHAADWLRRHGGVARTDANACAQCHGQAFCADCHDGRAPFPAADFWPDRPDRGFVHRANYLERHAYEARLEGPTCIGCHGVNQCRSCHADAGRGPGGLSPHPVGWASPGPGQNAHAAAARRDLLECASCHSGAGADVCVTCHAVGRPGGSPHGLTRPAGDVTRDRPCTACHGGAR